MLTDPAESTLASQAREQELEKALSTPRVLIKSLDTMRSAGWPILLFGPTYVIAMLVFLSQVHHISMTQLVAAAILVPLYVAASLITYEDEAAWSVPTQPLLVAMLFLTPLALVPTLVWIATGLALYHDMPPGQPVMRWFNATRACWNCIGPVVVLMAADLGAPSVSHWNVYVLAFAAHYVIDKIGCAAVDLKMKQPIIPGVVSMVWIDLVDLALASIGLAAVIATDGSLWAIAFATAPVFVLAVTTQDRRRELKRSVVITEAFDDAIQKSRFDALTGIANRRAWDDGLATARYRMTNEPGLIVSVLVADLDGLKHVNDTAGHQLGDELIRAASRVICESVPEGALVARLGGDEFGVLLIGPEQALLRDEVVRAIRVRLATEKVVGIRVSMSVGAASCPPEATIDDAVALADRLSMFEKHSRGLGRDGPPLPRQGNGRHAGSPDVL